MSGPPAPHRHWLSLAGGLAILLVAGIGLTLLRSTPVSTKVSTEGAAPTPTPQASPTPSPAGGPNPSPGAAKPDVNPVASSKATSVRGAWSIRADGCVPAVLYAAPVAEDVTATELPPGFAPASRGPVSPAIALGVSYSGPADASVGVDVMNNPPAGAGLFGPPIATATVNGQPALVSRGGPPPASAAALTVVWDPQPEVALQLQATGLPEAEVLQIADGVVFAGGSHPAETPSCSPTRPVVSGAISRGAGMTKIPTPRAPSSSGRPTSTPASASSAVACSG